MKKRLMIFGILLTITGVLGAIVGSGLSDRVTTDPRFPPGEIIFKQATRDSMFQEHQKIYIYYKTWLMISISISVIGVGMVVISRVL